MTHGTAAPLDTSPWSTPERSEGVGWGVVMKGTTMPLTPTRRFAPTSPFQGEVSSRTAVPELNGAAAMPITAPDERFLAVLWASSARPR